MELLLAGDVVTMPHQDLRPRRNGQMFTPKFFVSGIIQLNGLLSTQHLRAHSGSSLDLTMPHLIRVLPRRVIRTAERRLPSHTRIPLRPKPSPHPFHALKQTSRAHFATTASMKSSTPTMTSTSREFDPEIKDMASYIHNYKIDSDLAVCFPLPCSRSWSLWPES